MEGPGLRGLRACGSRGRAAPARAERRPPAPWPQASAEAVAARGAFTIALSGGSLIKALAGLVGRSDLDFSKWCARCCVEWSGAGLGAGRVVDARVHLPTQRTLRRRLTRRSACVCLGPPAGGCCLWMSATCRCPAETATTRARTTSC